MTIIILLVKKKPARPSVLFLKHIRNFMTIIINYFLTARRVYSYGTCAALDNGPGGRGSGDLQRLGAGQRGPVGGYDVLN